MRRRHAYAKRSDNDHVLSEPIPVRSKRASTGSIAFQWSHWDPSVYRELITGTCNRPRGTVTFCDWQKFQWPVRGGETRPSGTVAKIETSVVAAARDYGTSTSRYDSVVYANRASPAVTNTCMAIAFSIDSAFLWTLRVLMIPHLGLGPNAPLSELFVCLRQANTPTSDPASFNNWID